MHLQCRRQEFNPWDGEIPRGGHGYPLQDSCLENIMDRGAWWAAVHRVTKSQTQLKWLSTHTVCIYLAEWHFKILKCRQWEPKFFSKILFCITSAWAQWALRTRALRHWAPTLCSLQLSSVAQLCLTLQPHGPQHARPPCPSPTPGVYTNSCPLSQWCHPTISSSVVPFSSCPQFFPASGSFQMSQLCTSGSQSLGVSASVSVLPMNTQDWSLGWTGWISLLSEGLSRMFSNTTVQKHQFFSAQLSL